MAVISKLRADARRNRERVFAAAKAAFEEQGAETSMEDIARRAEVGVGTLYRAYKSRSGLVEALFADQVDRLEARAAQLAGELEPWEALTTWLYDYVAELTSKRTMLTELIPLFQQRPQVLEHSRRRAADALAGLLRSAEAAGRVRADLEAQDVLRLVNGILSPGEFDRDRTGLLLTIVLAGIGVRDSAK